VSFPARANEPRKSLDQADLILARMQVADVENERAGEREALHCGVLRGFARKWAELGSRRVGRDGDFSLVQIAIGAQDRPLGELTAGQDLGGAADSAAHGPAQLKRALGREILRVLQEADVMNAHHDRRRATHRRGVLHMQQVRTVPAEAEGKVEA